MTSVSPWLLAAAHKQREADGVVARPLNGEGSGGDGGDSGGGLSPVVERKGSGEGVSRGSGEGGSRGSAEGGSRGSGEGGLGRASCSSSIAGDA